jgi:hypothetical protein
MAEMKVTPTTTEDNKMRLRFSIVCLGLALAAGGCQRTEPERVPEPAAGAVAELSPIERGKYLVTIMGCNDCHTPLKFGPNGPEPDMARLLSGHPEGLEMPPPPLQPGPWWMATNMTAFAGPWGISYTINITPDSLTGIGSWSEETFTKAMRTGRHMGASRPILPPMPWQSIAALTDTDMKAMYAYLRSIPPLRNKVPEPVIADTTAAGSH